MEGGREEGRREGGKEGERKTKREGPSFLIYFSFHTEPVSQS